MATLKTIGGVAWKAVNVISWAASKAAGATWGEAGQAKAFKVATIVDWCTPGVPVGSALVLLAVAGTVVVRLIRK